MPIPDYVGDHFANDANKINAYVRKEIICKDGTRYSVQASSLHYCSPKDNVGPWTAFEVLATYRKSGSGSIKGWIPKETINQWIHRHGGAV